MTLSAGTRLGPYEILAPIGAGGMGEVYRARDTRLERTVAVKILPSLSTPSPEARQRFEREAKTISQLSHPHICALYDVGREGETEYLVMEYLEGQTLSERLGQGSLPLEQTLRYGIEIAEALDKAHRQGIVHRDLKPGNVMLTKSGVKLLDFGLAKAFSAPASSASVFTVLPTAGPDVTREGAILGTVQYMSPEQLEGKEADARTDIFALGCVLYEMATGRKAFSGTSQASLISSIMKEDPAPISTLAPLAPPVLDRIVKTCLAKDPEDRWQTARDVALQLQFLRDEGSAAGPRAPLQAQPGRAAILPWIIGAAGLALAVLALTSRLRQNSPARAMLSFLVPPPNTSFQVYGANNAGVALSPDGRRLAFGTREPDGSSRLWVRELDALDPYPVPGGDGVLFPFWSPDSRSIGFFAKGRLKVVEASPSPPLPRELADVVEPRGGSWAQDGTILYSGGNLSPVMRVAAAGGKPTAATRLASDEIAHRWPHFLPDGRRFLYEIRKASPDPNAPAAGPHAIYQGSLDVEERHLILSEHTSATYVSPGYLIFRRANNLMAVACDPKSLAIRGEPLVVVSDIQGFAATGGSIFSVSGNLLVYSPRVGASSTRIVWLDRSGKELSTVGPPDPYVYMGVSADGGSAVVARIEDPLPPDLWLFDTVVGRGMRLTRDAVAQVAPVISSDGKRIFFSAYSKGPWDLWEMTPQGAKEKKPFLESGSTKTANDISPDGRYLLYREFDPRTRGDLKVVPLNGDRQPRTYLATPDDESNGDFSPDGRWVAYASDESGRKEVYAASFPDPTRRFRVSADGGSQPRWSRDGKELFYVRAGQLLTVPVGRQGDDPTFGQSRLLFPLPFLAMNDPGFDQITRYDVAPDGRFLALLRSGEDAPTPLVLVQNWRETLKKP
jgi:Tol biopolymer transport system component